MYSAIKRIGTALAIAAMMASCSQADPDKKAAQELLAEATRLMGEGNAEQALALMDTIDTKYASQVDVRREALGLRPRAIEQVTMRQISVADSLLAATQIEINELQGAFTHVSGDDLEGYYIVSGAKGGFINSTGIEPRVNDANHMFYIVAQISGKTIGINQIILSGADGSMASQTIPASSARVAAIEGSELASFLPEEVNDLGQWAAEHSGSISKATVAGTKGKQEVKLSADQAAAIGKAWRYASAMQRHRQAALLREKLDRRLQVARDQAAQHAPEATDEQ